MACKIIEPISGNVICEYEGHYFCRKRHRDGRLWEPVTWMGITKDWYQMFKDGGSQVLQIIPDEIVNYVKVRKENNYE